MFIRGNKFYSLYFRIWMAKTVFILVSKEGFKTGKKNRNAFKIIIGMVSY
ncbi:DUF3977 family protein [Fictibacillus sp. KIGAM418]|uniref:DUF3977 family protein n=1 Tax=Fictibacillus marinisediminis TaxID=2878389 RepID=A0A9X2BGE0_9BACL|nr:DUF3977 family protein [Fictibacillus marinisediminis]